MNVEDMRNRSSKSVEDKIAEEKEMREEKEMNDYYEFVNSTFWEENQYKALIQRIIRKDHTKVGRNGTTSSIFGQMLSVNLQQDGFPIISGRKMNYRGVFGELAAMLKMADTVKGFEDEGCNYWNQWADKDGKLDLDYGKAWRDYNGIDQLQEVINLLLKDRNSRRVIMTGWRPDRLEEISLPCCHLLYQWYVRDGHKLDMIWYQRSVDVMVGLPSDMIFAAALNTLIAKQTGLTPSRIIFMLGDCHIYKAHYQTDEDKCPIETYLEASKSNKSVGVSINPAATIDNFNVDSIQLHDYFPNPTINFEVQK